MLVALRDNLVVQRLLGEVLGRAIKGLLMMLFFFGLLDSLVLSRLFSYVFRILTLRLVVLIQIVGLIESSLKWIRL